MKETFISTNNLQTEFANSRLSRMFNGFNEPVGSSGPSAKRPRVYWDKETRKYAKSDIGNKLLDFLSSEDWSSAGNKTSYNTIQLLNKYGVVKKFYLKDPTKKSKAYLKLANGTKFYIRNQDQFHYALVSELHGWFEKHSRPDIISDLFYLNDGMPFVNEDKITIETTEKTSGGHLRTDMAFYVRGYKIVVEYLENQHDQDKLMSHEFDRVRALRLLGDTNVQSYRIAHIAFFWQKHLWSKETKRYTFNIGKFYEFVEHIGQTILDYYLISNEDAYCINKLTQITGNQSLSEQIYAAHSSPNEPVINLEILESLFKWGKHPNPKVSMEKVWYAEFVDRIKKMQGEILALKASQNKNLSAFDSMFDDSDSDAESDMELDSDNISCITAGSDLAGPTLKIPDDKLVYYQVKDREIYLTHFGLHVYIDMGPKYLSSMYEYFKIRKFYNDITSGLIDAIKELRAIKESYQSNQIYGLDNSQ